MVHPKTFSEGCLLEWTQDARVYRHRKPKTSPLYPLLNEHYYEVEVRYDELFTRSHGFVRPIIGRIIDRYLECGDLHVKKPGHFYQDSTA